MERLTRQRPQFDELGTGLLVRAPAKINLSLLIAGKRPDGFHEIETVMAKITWYDEIFIEPGRRDGIELVCKGPHWAPHDKTNLVYRAAELLRESARIETNLKITLIKRVPAGAGLGSASSDAAATLLGVDRFCRIGTPHEHLHELACRLGSDVPFFLDGPLALCTGKGEIVQPLDAGFGLLVLLILPNVTVSTKTVYASYRHDESMYRKLHIQTSEYIEKNRIDLLAGMCANMLERSCFDIEEKLDRLRTRLQSLAIEPLCLTGSGSAMFCAVAPDDEDRAKAYAGVIAEQTDCTCVIARGNGW